MGFSSVIYQLVRQIPRGKVASYGQLAFLAGKPRAARMVGQILSRCSDPSVPCHRVLRQDGSTVKAFDLIESDVQRRLLEEEGVRFLPDGKADMKACQWRP